MRRLVRILVKVLAVGAILWTSNLVQLGMMDPKDHVGNNQVSNAYLARSVGVFVVPLGMAMGAVPNFVLSGIEK